MSFLTVEDINSTLIKYRHINIFHNIDTSKISLDEFSEVKYDFCKITHTISSGTHTFTFKIVNSIWTGAYYFTDINGNYLDVDGTYDTNSSTLTLSATEEAVILVLYCTNLTDAFNLVRLTWRPISLDSLLTTSISEISQNIPVQSLNDENLTGKSYSISSHIKELNIDFTTSREFGINDNNEFTIVQTANPNSSVNYISYNGAKFYFDFFIKKVAPEIEINNELTVGKVNRVELTVSRDFTQSNGYIPINQFPYLKGYVYYEDNTIPIQFDSTNNKYYFEMDLKEKTKNSRVKFNLEILETDYIQGTTYEFEIASKYVSIDNISDLIYELGVNGSKIIELSGDFNLVGDINVSHDILIYGKGHNLNLNNHSFILKEGVTLKANKLSFNKGDNAIIQNKNTILDLTECNFYNCKSENYNNIGSCIFCDVDLESLSVDDDFTTILTNCLFKNNHSAILHGGQLTIDNCKFRNTDSSIVDMNNPAFIYQVDGDAVISNSIFDIDISDESLCSNSENIGFSQAILMCGETATINRANHSSLQSNNSLPFFDSPYYNTCHLFVKYYYPQISSCVFSSPSEYYEDKSCCHAVSGVDWIFKNNVEITKASWESENTTRKIEWED